MRWFDSYRSMWWQRHENGQSIVSDPIDVKPVKSERRSDTFMSYRCPECGSKDIEQMDDVIKNEKMVRCRSCGLEHRYPYDKVLIFTKDLFTRKGK